jgi:rapamycin-insensitive companion of mTOR
VRANEEYRSLRMTILSRSLSRCQSFLQFSQFEGPLIVVMNNEENAQNYHRTCFFVIGLIASTEQGAEILSDYGWSAATTSLGDPTGICVPEDIGKFMTVRPIS